jgi:hypothetical protein
MMLPRSLALAGLLVAIAGPAGAQPFPVGPEVRISDDVFANEFPAAPALSPEGDLFVAWGSSSQGGTSVGIYGRRYSLADFGNPGLEMRISQAGISNPFAPEVAWLADGRFLVTWSDNEALPGARFFSRDGAPLSDSLPLALELNSYPIETLVLPSGGFLTLWTPFFSFNPSREILGRIFRPHGSPAGPELVIAGDGADTPAAAVSPGGGFTVAWRVRPVHGSPYLAFQRFSRTGSALGHPVFLDPGGSSLCCTRVALDPRGNLILSWSLLQTAGQGSPSTQVWRSFLQRFGPAGRPLSPRIEVDPADDAQDHVAGSLLVDPGGNVIVTWREGRSSSYPSASGFGARLRLFGPDLSPRGAAVQLNSSTAGDHLPGGLAADGHGNLIATWSGPDADGFYKVYLRRFRLPCAPGPDCADTQAF